MSDPAIARRNKAARRRGAQWQSDIRNALRDGQQDVEEQKLSGSEDEGDLVVRLGNGRFVVIEAKNEQRISLATYIAEALVEADNFAKHRPGVDRQKVLPVVAVKARGKGTQDAYVVLRLGDFFDFTAQVGVK